MNKVILVGRIVRAPYKSATQSGLEISRFEIAVDRNYRNANNENITDFIPCVAFGTNATFINKYLYKGSLISVEGSFQSNRTGFGNDGRSAISYSVNVERVQGLESKELSEKRRQNQQTEFSISQEETKSQVKEVAEEQPSPEDIEVEEDDFFNWDISK
ncbi:single-stranded DNA-binding protein [[Mycoplasma] falconis]|uniref:Single-stranded DNA-binding protein n=1 Tax=[Mycoplasma] falconis TaxID=92403 RepID=A0A501X9K0_9BACT|nr:single-stranded DNA-binding protein [[Mycoplasma] falconis]TPE57200.1 single-stranded DNA-binding protein [[Mycoplasma] falconis]